LKFINNILIIGGTGFIGYHLAKESLKRGWRVTSISSKSPKKIRYLSKVKYIKCDITKKKSLKKINKKYFKYIVNLGGYVDHSNKQKIYKSHYTGCKNLTNIFLKKPPLAFVQIGSSMEYGKVKSPQIEDMRCNPQSAYGEAKFLSSKHLIDISKKKKFPSTILRLYQAYGPKQDLNRLIPIVIDNCLKNKKFPCSMGVQLRDFLHVDDVVQAVFKSLINKNARGQIFNIGSGKPKQIKKIIQYVQKKTKGGLPLFGKIKLRKEEMMKIYPSISKAKIKINWKPKVSFERGLNATINSYRKSL